jgi:hypothetical protein
VRLLYLIFVRLCGWLVLLGRSPASRMRIPPRSPTANAYAERFVLTPPTEVTDQMPIFGQRHLRTILAPVRGPLPRARAPSQPPAPPARPDYPVAGLSQQQIQRRPILGGLPADTMPMMITSNLSARASGSRAGQANGGLLL